jgi:uracil-DNA glycosylase
VTAVPTDDVYERYLQRAIREINQLHHDIATLADATHVPVLSTGHPLADIFLVKHAPTAAEITEGVAFFGRTGNAVIKSLERLKVDPMAVYGTYCFKYGTEDRELAAAWLTRELHIVQPKLVVAMGEETVAFINRLGFPLAQPLDAAREGELQQFTPTVEALVTPDIDASVDEQGAKTRFWNAFRPLGPWWAELPPD